MQIISICDFRASIQKYCRLVRLEKEEEIVVLKNYTGVFKLIACQNIKGSVLTCVPFSQVRDNMGDFLDLLEQHQKVVLTSYGKAKALCVKL